MQKKLLKIAISFIVVLFIKNAIAENAGIDTDPPDKIIIDNFLPYIKEINVLKENATGDTIYKSLWNYSGEAITLNTTINDSIVKTDKLYIKVVSSEALDSLTLSIPGISYYKKNTVPVDASIRDTWIFQTPAVASSGDKAMVFAGRDLAGNSLLQNIATMPYRTGDSIWSVGGLSLGTDSRHMFIVKRTMGDRAGIRIRYKDLNSAGLPGQKKVALYFDAKQNPDFFTWDFGDATTADTVMLPEHIYNEATNYQVKLHCTFPDGSTLTDSVHIYLNPTTIIAK